jgi:probable HAF family extracellular repeat protein
MLFANLFHRWRGKVAPDHEGQPRNHQIPRRRARPQAGCVPRVEALEDRTVPSGGYVFSTIDDPSGVFATVANGINARGQIVGTYADASGAQHGFLRSDGHYTTLDDPNAGGANGGTVANGINDRGQVVGSYVDGGGAQHGFLLSGGQYTTLDDPNGDGTGTFATGINDSGQVVGLYFGAGGQHGFVLSGGQYTTLDDPNGEPGTTLLNGINNSGKIVGAFADATGNPNGFLATPAHGDALLPSRASDCAHLLLPIAALPNATRLGNQVIPVTGGSEDNAGDGSSAISTGQTTPEVTVPNTLPGSGVSGVRRAHVVFAAGKDAGLTANEDALLVVLFRWPDGTA